MAEQLSVEELEKKWENDVDLLIEEADDEQNIIQDKKLETKLQKQQ